MRRFLFLIMFVLLIAGTVMGQGTISPATPIPPPDGYMDSCSGEARDLMLHHFGPNCLNPVLWDLPGMPRIGTWMFFVRDDGTTDAGLLMGFSWQWDKGLYHYHLMTEMPYERYAGAFENIAPGRVIRQE